MTVLDSTSVELSRNGATRSLKLPRYGDPGSQGQAAYAALLHGTGLSNSTVDPAATMLPGTTLSDSVQPDTAPRSVQPLNNFAPLSHAQAVQIPATATPLEQLRALRQQLIHPR